MAEVLVGYVNVEAGCLQIGDPCVGARATHEDVFRAASAQRALDTGDVEVTPIDVGSHVLVRATETTVAVAHLCLTHLGGDGCFPVYAEVEDRLIRSIRIDIAAEQPATEEQWQQLARGPAKRLHV